MVNIKLIEEAKNTRNEVMTYINRHPEGLTVAEVIRGMKPKYGHKTLARVLRYLYNARNIDRVPSDIRTHTYIPRTSEDDINKPIAHLYDKYYRGEVPILSGGIPPLHRRELIEVVENNVRIKETTPKDISMRVKFMDERGNRIATLVYDPDGKSGIIYELGNIIEMDDEGILNYLRRGVVGD